MNEARRFIRYVIPGLVFATQFIILLGLLRPDWISEFLHQLKKDSGLGLLFATLLASGGAGMVFSCIYHYWHWEKGTAMDHKDVLIRLDKEGILNARDVDFKTLCREDAWIILTALWHERLKSNETIGSADPKVADMLDLVHSIGTSRVAALVAAIVAFAVAASFSQFDPTIGGPCIRFIIALVLAFSVPWLLHANFVRIARLAQGVIDQVLSDALMAEGKLPEKSPASTDDNAPKESTASTDGNASIEGKVSTWPLLPRK
jgi:hypothetical protein